MNIAKVAKAVVLAGTAFGIGASVVSCKKEEPLPPREPIIDIYDPIPVTPSQTDSALFAQLYNASLITETLPPNYQSLMAELIIAVGKLQDIIQKEFWTWFNKNKPENFGTDANATERFFADCRAKLKELGG